MIKAVLFDLDGTLLPMDEEVFTKGYFSLLCKKLVPLGYEKEKLIYTIMTGTEAMRNNDGNKTNKQAFWDVFVGVFGCEISKHEILFKQFYENEFKNSKAFCGDNPDAKKIIEHAKKLGFKIILASNPLFPKEGMLSRAGFVGLDEKHFDYISTYETSSYSKPNPNYYLEILKQNNLKPNEVIYFGNSERDDFIPATEVNIKTYLVGESGIKEKDFLKVLKEIK